MTSPPPPPPRPPRDWDKELAEIDRLIAKVPPGGQAAAPATRQAPRVALPAAPPRGRREVWGTWGRVLLGAALGLAVTQWPYAHRCGMGLVIYSGVVGMVALAGLWGAAVSWRRRLGLAHLLSLGVLVWGLGLAAAVLLPRIGYARQQLTWFCP